MKRIFYENPFQNPLVKIYKNITQKIYFFYTLIFRINNRLCRFWQKRKIWLNFTECYIIIKKWILQIVKTGFPHIFLLKVLKTNLFFFIFTPFLLKNSWKMLKKALWKAFPRLKEGSAFRLFLPLKKYCFAEKD